MARYEVWYCDDLGNRLELIDRVTMLEYALVSGDLGWLALALPADATRRYNVIAPDRQLHVYRQPYGGALELECVAFGRRWAYDTDASGLTTTRLSGPDLNDLLRRRIVAYAAASSEADKTAEADDMMKEIVDENLVNPTDTDRDTAITAAADLTLGPSVTKAFAWQNVLSTLQGIQAASKTAGTEVFFAISPTSSTAYQFQTHTGQPGADRTLATGSRPLVFGLARGNVAAPFYEEDYSLEATYVYSGGRGLGADRNVQEAEDTDRSGRSAWGRAEAFTNASNADTDAGVLAAANEKLTSSRPLVRFSAQLLSTPETPYGGAGWRQGDRVTVDHLGRQFDVIIRAVHVRVSGDGAESITAAAEYEA